MARTGYYYYYNPYFLFVAIHHLNRPRQFRFAIYRLQKTRMLAASLHAEF